MFGVIASMVDGLLLGAVYGLAAIGLTLIWGVMNIINLTHGALIALGMFGVYFLTARVGGSPYVALLPVAVLGFVAGLAIYGLSVHRVIARPPLMSLLSTFAVNMVIIGAGTAFWSTSIYNLPFSVPGITWQGFTFTGAHMLAAAVAVVVAGALYLFMRHTRLGKAIRAVANNRQAAELMGIPSGRILAVAFALGVALAAVAGGLIATLFPFTVLSGSGYQLKSFVVTVLGGLGNPAGALVGGLLLGLIEGGVTPFIAVSWTPVIEFVLFVLILIAFPKGLFARGAAR